MEKHKEETRDARGLMWIEELIQDVRYSGRVHQEPGFTAIAIVTLALGIGANTAIFSVINAAFFAPYGLEEPERLVRLWGQDLKRSITQLGFSVPKRESPRSADLLRIARRDDAAGANLAAQRQRAGPGQWRAVDEPRFSTAWRHAGRAIFHADEERGANVAVLGEDLGARDSRPIHRSSAERSHWTPPPTR